MEYDESEIANRQAQRQRDEAHGWKTEHEEEKKQYRCYCQ